MLETKCISYFNLNMKDNQKVDLQTDTGDRRDPFP